MPISKLSFKLPAVPLFRLPPPPPFHKLEKWGVDISISFLFYNLFFLSLVLSFYFLNINNKYQNKLSLKQLYYLATSFEGNYLYGKIAIFKRIGVKLVK